LRTAHNCFQETFLTVENQRGLKQMLFASIPPMGSAEVADNQGGKGFPRDAERLTSVRRLAGIPRLGPLDRKQIPLSASQGFAAADPNPAQGDQPLLFAGFRLEADGSLFRGKSLVHLPPRELAALRLLVANAGQIVTPQQLKQALWGDVHVTADSLPKCLSSLRTRLEPEDCIQTVYKRGYRLLAEVHSQNESAGGALPRLAILPFATELDVPEHLGSAIAEDAIAHLSNAQKPLASMLARDSVFSLALRGLTAQQIGEALNADFVLAGTVRALPSRFRLRAEMIRIADGVQIWVEDLLVEPDRIASLDAELATRLYSRLQTRAAASLHGSSPDSADEQHTESNPASSMGFGDALACKSSADKRSSDSVSLAAAAESLFDTRSNSGSNSSQREAYELYLRGHHEWQTLERHRMQDGLQHLTRAAELDPTLVNAKVDMAYLGVTQALYGYMSPSVASELVHQVADSIADLPNQAERFLPALAWVQFHFDRDLPTALQSMQSSAHLPHDPWTTRARAMFLLSRHRFSDAISLLRAAIQLDSYSPSLNARLAWALHLSGDADASLEQIEHAIRLFPDYEGTCLYGAIILAFNGHTGRALGLADALAQGQPQLDPATAVQAYVMACAGETGKAGAILERLQWLNRERYILRTFNPAAYAELGNLEAAMVELRAANELRCPWFFQMLADPRLKPLHGMPEFEEIRGILPRMEAAVQQS
jgi:DNA-binding winged helix-turn-helix (wHTH) protein